MLLSAVHLYRDRPSVLNQRGHPEQACVDVGRGNGRQRLGRRHRERSCSYETSDDRRGETPGHGSRQVK